jgi:hypothetical protein
MDAFNPVPPPVLAWMESSWLHSFMHEPWTWVITETIHFTGMCLLFGPIIIIDLRLVGVGRRFISASSVHVLIPVALVGFGMNLVTGVMFCFGLPYRYAMNISFQIKMVLVVLAGINALYFWRKASRALAAIGSNDDPPLELKLVGITSLLLWTGVIGFGRMIPYLGTG